MSESSVSTAFSLFQSLRFEMVVKQCEYALRKNPDDSLFHFLKAIALAELEEFEQAFLISF